MNLEQRRAREFLHNNKIATIATISPEHNGPQAAFVYYVTDDNSHIYIVTSTESRKIKNILANNNVALCIGQEGEALVLQIEGTAHIVDDEEKKTVIAGKYLDIANESNPKSWNLPPVMKIPSENGFMVIEIIITNFKFSDFSGREAQIITGTSHDWHQQ